MSLTEKNKQEKNIANNFQKLFSDILGKIVTLANGRINNNLLNSGEIVTDKTLEAERKSSNLTQIQIDTNITLMESELKSGNLIINEELVNVISNINKQTLPIIKNFLEEHKVFRFIFLIVCFTLSVAYLVDSTFNPFLYFRF